MVSYSDQIFELIVISLIVFVCYKTLCCRYNFSGIDNESKTAGKTINDNVKPTEFEECKDFAQYLEYTDAQNPHQKVDTFYNVGCTLNVNGQKYMVLWTTLKKIPNSRLGKLAQAQTHEQLMQHCDSYSIKDNEYFFSTDTKYFASILNLYRTGKLHTVDKVGGMGSIIEALAYWGIDESYVDHCCQMKLNLEKEAFIGVEEIANELLRRGHP